MREAGDRLVFWIRLHPAMLETREAIRSSLSGEAAMELDEPTDVPLQALLASTDVHLTHSSSTIIEASQFEVRSVVTSDYGAEIFGPMIAEGWAEVETGSASRVVDALLRHAAPRARPDWVAPVPSGALAEILGAAPSSPPGSAS
jgi:hypothetical protein